MGDARRHGRGRALKAAMRRRGRALNATRIVSFSRPTPILPYTPIHVLNMITRHTTRLTHFTTVATGTTTRKSYQCESCATA